MARDPRKGGAFDSGMRGKEKAKPSSGSENKQSAGNSVGDPRGVDLSAYTSGMRGPEKAKQKDASGSANKFAEEGSTMGGESKQGPDTVVGHPKGHSDAAHGNRTGVSDGDKRSKASDAYGMGRNDNAVNSSEAAAQGHQPSGEGILGEEDDTHINIRIPKSSLKKKQSGMAGSV